MTPLLTIFTAPKPFTDSHIRVVQRNAILSWLQLGPEVEVLLLGEEEGIAEVADELGILHLPDVVCSAWGTPLVSSLFALARQHGQGSLLAYVNADILLLSDFLMAVKQVAGERERFLMVGQRWDLDVTAPLAFSAGWEAQIRERVHKEGRLHPPKGSDYFVFPCNAFKEIPPFSIGRAGWDNWMIYWACKKRWSVVDATKDVMAIHQNHDYRHLPGGRPHFRHPESERNRSLAGERAVNYCLIDATEHLWHGRLEKVRRGWQLDLLRKMELFLAQWRSKKIIRPVFRRVRRAREVEEKKWRG